MDRYICIHGHFYQPPRENPWLEFVELQDLAYPYHDWNSRIAAESYAPNAASRIISKENKIIDIVNNYSRISFNFGPTLLSWLKSHRPDIYEAILEADRLSQKNFSGHGSALAQCYSHMIMPLANQRDKKTQVVWAIKDFEHHFSRYPEGMWLPETAVDIPTLEVLAQMGIKFSILAPGQAARVKNGQDRWVDVTGAKIDPKHPYTVNLPSGNRITIFFYDGPISNDIGFGGLLKNGEEFAQRLLSAFSDSGEPQLVHIATDGETYGHHHRFGDMALSYCLHHLESNNLAKITNYGQYLEEHPPGAEAEIVANSSWSCAHGICRWTEDCGCNTGANPAWNQKWRKPLREAMDWLSDESAQIFQNLSQGYLKNPWEARDNYIRVILDRSRENVEGFLKENSTKELDSQEQVTVLKLLEMQRHAMLIFTSCGWFFDEISRIETVQVLMYAARVMQLVKELTGQDHQEEFIGMLEEAPSNIKEYKNGAGVYRKLVLPAVLDLFRVGVNYAVSSMFEKYPEHTRMYSYQVKSHIYDRTKMGRQTLAVGRSTLLSDITWESSTLKFAVLHLGDHNLIGGIHQNGQGSFEDIHKQIKETFTRSDIPQTISLMDKYFGSHNYSLWHLFKDKQREIISRVTKPGLKEIEQLYRQIYEHNYPVMQAMNQMNIPLPEAFSNSLKFIFETDLVNILKDKKAKLKKLSGLVEEISRWPIELDTQLISYVADNTINSMMKQFYQTPKDRVLLETIKSLLKILKPLNLDYGLWEAQNLYFYLSRQIYPQVMEQAEQGDRNAEKWVSAFRELDSYMPSRSL
ncbi:MAG: DUF3536 domain-containing protein [Actinomycetota bacterium]